MAEPPRYSTPNPEAGDDAAVPSGQRTRTGSTRWQKVVGAIGLLVVLWVGNQMVGQLTGRGMDHVPSQGGPPAEIQEEDTGNEDGGHRPPAGVGH